MYILFNIGQAKTLPPASFPDYSRARLLQVAAAAASHPMSEQARNLLAAAANPRKEEDQKYAAMVSVLTKSEVQDNDILGSTEEDSHHYSSVSD